MIFTSTNIPKKQITTKRVCVRVVLARFRKAAPSSKVLLLPILQTPLELASPRVDVIGEKYPKQ
jgi:hypothetical protein